MAGDEVPPEYFDWCSLCSRAAFRGVIVEAERRRRSMPVGEMMPGSASVPQHATTVMQGPAANVSSWLPRRGRRDLEDTRIVGERPL